MASNTDQRPSLAEHFQDSNTNSSGDRWEALYKNDYIPWDKGLPSPALVDLLEERHDLLPVPGQGRKALVPGCGKGYDALLLSSWGFDVYGLDVAPSAIAEAKRTETALGSDPVYALKDGVSSRGSISWILGDFFTDEKLNAVQRDEKFDLIYDYTFGCALPPSMRVDWSRRHKDLLAPQGRLVCLEFPTYKAPSLKGPPWAMPPKVYLAHLQRPGQSLDFNDDDGIIEAALGPPAQDGLQRLAHFQPKRGHAAAYVDGKMTDWLSVWTHGTVNK